MRVKSSFCTLLAAAALLAGCAPSAPRTAAPDPELAALRQRVEKLERDRDTLTKIVTGLHGIAQRQNQIEKSDLDDKEDLERIMFKHFAEVYRALNGHSNLLVRLQMQTPPTQARR